MNENPKYLAEMDDDIESFHSFAQSDTSSDDLENLTNLEDDENITDVEFDFQKKQNLEIVSTCNCFCCITRHLLYIFCLTHLSQLNWLN